MNFEGDIFFLPLIIRFSIFLKKRYRKFQDLPDDRVGKYTELHLSLRATSSKTTLTDEYSGKILPI